MIAADEWHKYQENYIKYGVDLTPEAPRVKKVASKTTIKTTAKERMIILAMIVIAGFCLTGVVFMQAVASDINYTVCSLNQEITSISGDIDNMNVELNSYNRLADIEYRAENELHMVYPETEQYIYVEDMKGSAEVNAYIASLTAQEKGIVVQKNATVTSAAKRLLAGA